MHSRLIFDAATHIYEYSEHSENLVPSAALIRLIATCYLKLGAILSFFVYVSYSIVSKSNEIKYDLLRHSYLKLVAILRIFVYVSYSIVLQSNPHTLLPRQKHFLPEISKFSWIQFWYFLVTFSSIFFSIQETIESTNQKHTRTNRFYKRIVIRWTCRL